MDLCQSHRFLDLLEPNGQFTFQVFADRKPGPWPRVLHGTLQQHEENLSELNDQGAGIFVMVNAGDGIVHDGEKSCRVTANVTRVRALFADLDGAPIAPVLACRRLPDGIVQSSPGRWHAYWTVRDCPLDQFRSAQIAIADKFGSDHSVQDLPRVMRVPGFFHNKAEPFLSRLYLPTDYHEIQGVENE